MRCLLEADAGHTPTRVIQTRHTFLHTIARFSCFFFFGITLQNFKVSSESAVRMGSETAHPVDDRVAIRTSKKSTVKVPRKIHKAAREKLKRDQMNELFLDLGRTMDLDHPNNGKACILRETVRLLRELLTQVDNLRKENATLLSESNYVTIEKNELLEETSALDDQIKSLQREIDEKANPTDLNVSEPQNSTSPQLQEDHVAFPLVGHAPEATSVVTPVFVMPLHHDSQGFPSPFPEVNMPKVASGVSRPEPRYPSSSDSWPSHILTK
ncbi:Transcription factor [Sesamum alatum]|uniref:Transcription factor n=1 Tax=Sesamum alatum TaxID=300844 RepID=A0AAE1XU65_9LAMI|nr:Transcription factor [Sesamum alatum]